MRKKSRRGLLIITVSIKLQINLTANDANGFCSYGNYANEQVNEKGLPDCSCVELSW